MIKIMQWWLVCVCTMWSSLVLADADSDRLNTLLSTMRSMEADFTQTVTQAKTGAAEKSRGKVALMRPSKFRWTITAPDPQVIVADGKHLWVYDEVLKQATVEPLNKTLGTTPMLLLSGKVSAVDETFAVKKNQDAADTLVFELTPLKKDKIIQKVVLTFNHQVISQMVLSSVTGQKSAIEFNQVRINTELNDKLFRFTPPKDVDVIGAAR